MSLHVPSRIALNATMTRSLHTAPRCTILPRLQRRPPRNAILRCRAAKDGTYERPNRPGESTGNFTPYFFIEYSNDPETICRHVATINVKASVEHCFAIWNKWDNLVDFLDLIGEMIPKHDDPNSVTLLCYYRFGLLPILQILTLVRKTEILENQSIRFESTKGMPMGGIVEFSETNLGMTKVEFRFEHAMPTYLVMANVGRYGVENHMQNILKENMATFKMLAEGKLEFSDEKYNIDRHRREIEELEKAFHENAAVSHNEDAIDPLSIIQDDILEAFDVDLYGLDDL